MIQLFDVLWYITVMSFNDVALRYVVMQSCEVSGVTVLRSYMLRCCEVYLVTQ